MLNGLKDNESWEKLIGQKTGESALFKIDFSALQDEDLVATFGLNPGDVLITNNWRTLHGRTSFTGARVLSGCYISMDVFVSRSQALALPQN